MDQYTAVAYDHARRLTLAYSSSFGLSSTLFSKQLQKHIYAIYGLVRIADEIVDTYHEADAAALLDQLEYETYEAIKRHYSTNPIVHAFAMTANEFHITRLLIAPFFKSMRMDLHPNVFTDTLYRAYIHGSAEVIGLMCLKVFCEGNDMLYKSLESGARALGAAYQKVNFLRDFAEDYRELGRVYFPGVTYKTFDTAVKNTIIADIQNDFEMASPAIKQLPRSCRAAVATSYTYYHKLLTKLAHTPAATIKTKRIRIGGGRKLQLFAFMFIRQGFGQ